MTDSIRAWGNGAVTVSIRVISDPDGILEIEGIWNTLVRSSSENPLLLSGFMEQFMKLRLSRGWTPLVLVFFSDQTIVGIAPLVTVKKWGVRFVKFLSESWFSPDFIVSDGFRETLIAHALNYLLRNLKCQFVCLDMAAESPNTKILEQQCKANKIYFCAKRGRWADMGHSIVPVRSSWDEFAESRGWNFRRRFRRLRRNLDRAGLWRIVCIDNGIEKSDAIERVLEVERTSWKETQRARRGEEIDQDLLLIWDGLQHTYGVEPDLKCRIWFLELNDRTLAYTLVLQYKRTAYIAKTSYDERYKRLYPGIYINNAAIRELFIEDQVRKIDWLTDLPFHRNWTSLCLPRVRVVMTRRSLISRIIANTLASEYAKDILYSIPVLSKVLGSWQSARL